MLCVQQTNINIASFSLRQIVALHEKEYNELPEMQRLKQKSFKQKKLKTENFLAENPFKKAEGAKLIQLKTWITRKCANPCDQIWPNFANWAEFLKYLAIFWGFIYFLQISKHTLEILFFIGQILIVVSVQILKQ